MKMIPIRRALLVLSLHSACSSSELLPGSVGEPPAVHIPSRMCCLGHSRGIVVDPRRARRSQYPRLRYSSWRNAQAASNKLNDVCSRMACVSRSFNSALPVPAFSAKWKAGVKTMGKGQESSPELKAHYAPMLANGRRPMALINKAPTRASSLSPVDDIEFHSTSRRD